MTETPEEKAARIAEWEREPTQEEIDQAIANASRPALLLNKTKFPDSPGEPGCWLHGTPTLPPEIDWPHQEVGGVPWPLFFVAQIKLARVPRRPEFPKLPETGTLFFFDDHVFSTVDSKTLYVDDDVSKFPHRKMPDPEYRPVNEWSDDDAFELIKENILPRWNFDFLEIVLFEGTNLNGSIDHQIDKSNYEARRKTEDLTKDRWSSPESVSLQKMTFSYMFGCQRNTVTPKDEPTLLLVVGDATVRNFWISNEALSVRDFDKAFMTIGG